MVISGTGSGRQDLCHKRKQKLAKGKEYQNNCTAAWPQKKQRDGDLLSETKTKKRSS